jgi:prepilin-type N-terminal cleavage/methylation domain-containing protein
MFISLNRWIRARRQTSAVQSQTQGFTLMELMVVVAITGILGSIAAPSWLRFWDAQRAKGAQEEIYLGMRDTQAKAIRTNRRWRMAFRSNLQGASQWSNFPVDSLSPSSEPDATTQTWHSLSNNIKIDKDETTLRQSNGSWLVDFNHRGAVHGQLGRLTVIAADRPASRRCVIVSTLGGALREGSSVLAPAAAPATAPATVRQCD